MLEVDSLQNPSDLGKVLSPVYSDHLVLCTPPFLCTLRYNFSFYAEMVPILFLFNQIQYRPSYYQ